MTPSEGVIFKEGGVTVTLKIKQEQGEVRCTLLLDISEEGVLGDPYGFLSPCTVGTGTSVAEAVMDAAPAAGMAARVLMAMGERAAGLDALSIFHQIEEWADGRLGMSHINLSPKIG